VDVYPTLCELAGLPARKGLDGTSFVPVLKDLATSTREAITHVYPRGERLGRAIRTARYRLVEWKKPGAGAETAEYELYDYDADPEETRNLAREQPAVVARLRAIMARHPEAKPQLRRGPGPKRDEPRRAPPQTRSGRESLRQEWSGARWSDTPRSM
jgi:iduronate 2-sulfatase